MAVKIADTLKALSNTFPVAECIDIDVNIKGETKRLQKAIDDGEIGGSVKDLIDNLHLADNKTFSNVYIDNLIKQAKKDSNEYTDDVVSALTHLTAEVVDFQPELSNTVNKINVLLLYSADNSENYIQYLRLQDKLINLGSTSINLKVYYKKEEADEKFETIANCETIKNTIGDVTQLPTVAKDSLVNSMVELDDKIKNSSTKIDTIENGLNNKLSIQQSTADSGKILKVGNDGNIEFVENPELIDDTNTSNKTTYSSTKIEEKFGIIKKFLSSGDMNTIVDSGLYSIGSLNNFTNAPRNTNEYGVLRVTKCAAGITYQEWIPNNGYNISYRFQITNGTWENWQELVTTGVLNDVDISTQTTYSSTKIEEKFDTIEDGLNDKLSIQQSTTDSGKILKVGNDGNIEFVEDGSVSSWKGTLEEWEALSPEEKGKYEVVYFTNDYNAGDDYNIGYGTGLIDDTNISNKTTYSSEKIENLTINISSISAIPTSTVSALFN